jgi:hypothetical protein
MLNNQPHTANVFGLTQDMLTSLDERNGRILLRAKNSVPNLGSGSVIICTDRDTSINKQKI